MILLSSKWAKPLLHNGNVRFSPDLGLSFATANVSDGKAILPDGQVLNLKDIRKIVRDNRHVYCIRDNQIFKLVISAGKNTYKLTPSDGAPTFEINGVRMHPIKDTTPDKMVKKVMNAVRVKSRDTVLDICTGLGYTAQEAARRCAYVTTIEKDENVLELSRLNPWSKEFWKFVKSKKIKILIGDAFDVVKELKGKYNVIIHDPPRFSLAGELYSLEFYENLWRLGRRGARLYHYTGSPGERFRKKSVVKGVMERLRTAGWKRVRWVPSIQGVLAVKE